MKRNYSINKSGFLCFSLLVVLALFTGCKRADVLDTTTDPTTDPTTPTGQPVNDLIQVTASV